MTVILVLLTFLGFIVVDYFLNRRKIVGAVPVQGASPLIPARNTSMGSWFPID